MYINSSSSISHHEINCKKVRGQKQILNCSATAEIVFAGLPFSAFRFKEGCRLQRVKAPYSPSTRDGMSPCMCFAILYYLCSQLS